MKIVSLEVQNVKRVKAVALEPAPDGLTTIGGRNGQGKTSVLDAIAYALGGERLAPTNYRREGAAGESRIRVETDDGLVIERKGKNASLTVTDSTGRRAGQKLLDATIGRMSIDLPSFMGATDKGKADILLKLLGIGDQLEKLEKEEKAKYDLRTATGRMAEQKEKAAKELPWHEDAPEKPVDIADAAARLKKAMDWNAGNERARMAAEEAARKFEDAALAELDLKQKLEEATRRTNDLREEMEKAKDAYLGREDTPTDDIEREIADIEATNAKVRENQQRAAVLADAADIRQQYDELTGEIEAIRAKRAALLEGADLPYPGLSVEDGKLTLDGKAWDCMSSSMQLVVATAIAARLSPNCKFVLVDKLEQLDADTLREYDAYLRENGLQCIGTRVSTGGECSIVIEDGMVAGAAAEAPEQADDNKEETPEEDDFTIPDEV